MPMAKDFWLITGLLLALGIWAGTIDAQDAENSHREYCSMVALWDADAAQGVAPEQRAGWPPFDGRKQCETEE